MNTYWGGQMSDIYILQGKEKCGKSTTIKMIYYQLKQRYPDATIKIFYPNTFDIKIIMSNVKGKVIGIESQDNPNTRLKKSLADFKTSKCDIIICSAKTFGLTVQWINAYSKKYTIHYIKQIIANTAMQSTSNLNIANNIIKMSGL